MVYPSAGAPGFELTGPLGDLARVVWVQGGKAHRVVGDELVVGCLVGGGGRPAFLALLVLDPEVLRRDVLEPTLGGPEAPLLTVTDHRDRPVYRRTGAERPEVVAEVPLSEALPAWRLALYQPAGLSSRAAVDRQVMLFTVAFGLLLVVIAAGLAATYRLVRRETETARLKAEFVANVSHDLKTPLSLIRVFGETLEMGRVTDEATRQEYYRVITHESERLSRLIENVLDFSRIEGGRRTYDLVPVSVEPLVRDTVESFAWVLAQQGFKIDVAVAAGPARGADGRRRREPGAREPDRQRDQVLRGAEGPDRGGGSPGRRARPHGRRRGNRHPARGAGPDLRQVLPRRAERDPGPARERRGARPGAARRRGPRGPRQRREPAGRGEPLHALAPAVPGHGLTGTGIELGMPRILIVDDEPQMVRGLEDNLRFEGYQTLAAASGQEGLDLAFREGPDLVLLDVAMPGLSGWDVLRALRRKGIDIPVVMLTARGEEADRVLGLELGADDYITKPFSLRELLARVRAVLRRPGPRQRMDVFQFADVRLHLRARQAFRAGAEVRLTRKEFDLLRYLVEHPGEILTRERLLDEVWGYERFPTTRTVDTHVLRLRQKFERDPERPAHILTVHGQGYRFAG